MSQIGHLRVRKDKNGNNRYQMIVEVWRNVQGVWFELLNFGA